MSSTPLELTPPDIAPYRAGNTGVEYVTTFESGRPGPKVLVVALTHGNEICGAIAVDELFRSGVRPAAGTLTLAFANVAAFRTFNPADPNASRFVNEDFNRLWDRATLEGPRQSTELAHARALRPFVAAADYLLDLHSMQNATAPLMLTGLLDRSLDLARRVGVPALIVRDEGHAAGRRMRDYGPFGEAGAEATALLVECGQHWERRAAEVARDTLWRFLAAVGVLAPEEARRRTAATPEPQRVVTVTDAVTITTDQFQFLADYRGLEVIPKAGTAIARDGAAEVRTPYDDCVLIMPSRRLHRGQTAVRLGRFTG